MKLYPISHAELLRMTAGRGVVIDLKMRFNGDEWEAWVCYEGRGRIFKADNPWHAIAKLGSHVVRFRLIRNPSLRRYAKQVSRGTFGKKRDDQD